MPAAFQQYAYKTADETRDNIGEPTPLTPPLVDDADLQITLTPGVYEFNSVLHFYGGTSSTFASGIHWQLRFTGTLYEPFTRMVASGKRGTDAATDGITSTYLMNGYLDGDGGLVENGGTNLSYLLYQSGGSGNRMVADMNGIITVTATGVLKHAWAKRSNSAGSGPAQTLKIGSFLYTRQFC